MDQTETRHWNTTLECVIIDTSNGGRIFNVIFSDVPEKKMNVVSGKYDLPFSNKKTTVAVKIIDMRGEEVLVTEEV